MCSFPAVCSLTQTWIETWKLLCDDDISFMFARVSQESLQVNCKRFWVEWSHFVIVDELLNITVIKFYAIKVNFPAHIFASAVISYLSRKSRAEVWNKHRQQFVSFYLLVVSSLYSHNFFDVATCFEFIKFLIEWSPHQTTLCVMLLWGNNFLFSARCSHWICKILCKEGKKTLSTILCWYQRSEVILTHLGRTQIRPWK